MGFHKLLESLPVTTTLTEAAGFATLVFFLFYCILHKSRRNGERLLPGYPCPIIGNLHQLKQPAHRSLKNLAHQYGPIMLLRLGSVPTVVVSSSEMAKHFLKTHDSIFSSRPTTAAGKYLSYNFKGLIFSPYGDHWRQMRKLCVLELLTAKRMKSFKHVREEEVYATIRSIWEASKNGTASVNVSKAISTLSSNIIWRMLARKKFSDNDLGADGKGFKALILELSATTGAFNIGDFIPYLDWMDLQGIKRRMKKTNKTYGAFADKIIEDHLHVLHDHTAIDGQAEDVKDFVDVLLQMTAENDHLKGDTKATRDTIKAIMLDIFAAGTETTASTLEWVMSELLRHPDAMKRLQEEIESIVGKHRNVNESDVANMKYLQCVVKETLRLYPPAPLAIPHESTKSVTVSGYDIPNKTTVIVNVWAIGRDPNVWGADASEFKPERFLDVFDGPENSMDLTGQSDFRMLPFSAGRRGCPGAAMAILVIEFALAQLLHSFDWSVEGDPSKLDMTEACGSSTPRQVALYAFPTLRWGIF